MPKSIIEINQDEKYEAIKQVLAVNKITNNTHQHIINAAIDIAYNSVKYLDEETLLQVCQLKKSI